MTHAERYDLALVHALIERRVAGVGRVEVLDSGGSALSVLVIPVTPCGNPIYVRVVEDECRIRFGSGAGVSLGYGGEGDEAVILDVVDAIIRGRVVESAWLDDGGQLRFFSRIEGEHITSVDGEDVPAIPVRRLPAWE